jgi:hypothetical protein
MPSRASNDVQKLARIDRQFVGPPRNVLVGPDQRQAGSIETGKALDTGLHDCERHRAIARGRGYALHIRVGSGACHQERVLPPEEII